MWKDTDTDLHLTPYGCIATGDCMGMIEGTERGSHHLPTRPAWIYWLISSDPKVVPDAETTAAIQKAAGGVTAAFKQTPLANWLRVHNPLGAPKSQDFMSSDSHLYVADYSQIRTTPKP